MDTTTAAPQGAPSGVPSPAQNLEPGSEAAFQSLVDQGLLDDEAPANRGFEPEERWSATEEGEQRKPPEQKTEAPEQQAKEGEKAEPEGKTYSTLDEYLKDAQLEPESFMQLPVTVKVDGKEQTVPLAELQKSYQLSSAAYNRMNELSQERTSFQAEQKQLREAIAQRIEQTESLFKLAEQQLLQDYQAVPWQQLQQENPGQAALLYQQFQARQGAIQQHLQQIQATRQQEQQKVTQERERAFPGEWAKLLQVYPEMGDPAKGREARERIFAYAQKTGIPQDQVASLLTPQQFDAARVRTLLDAAAYAELKSKAPATVNRVRTAPPMGKPGTRQARDPNQVANQHLDERWAKSGFRDDEVGAAIFERFVS